MIVYDNGDVAVKIDKHGGSILCVSTNSVVYLTDGELADIIEAVTLYLEEEGDE